MGGKTEAEWIEHFERENAEIEAMEAERERAEDLATQPLDRAEQATVDHMAAYLDRFITRRFPQGLEGGVRQIISECVLDAYMDGSRAGYKEAKGESGIIMEVGEAVKLITV